MHVQYAVGWPQQQQQQQQNPYKPLLNISIEGFFSSFFLFAFLISFFFIRALKKLSNLLEWYFVLEVRVLQK